MKAFHLGVAMRAARDKRCDCIPCPSIVRGVLTCDEEVCTNVRRHTKDIQCGLVHHDQRGHYHARLRPHEAVSNRRHRREGMQRQEPTA